MFQLEQAQVKIKEADVQRKAEKDKGDLQIAAQKLELERQKMGQNATNEANRVASQERQAANSHKLDFIKTASAAQKQPSNGAK